MSQSLNIKTIDATTLDSPETLQALDEAASDSGVFLLKNHGIPAAQQSRLLTQATSFFTSDTDEKNAVRRSAINPWGYYDSELTKQAPDWKEIFDYGQDEDQGLEPQWPPGRPSLKEAVLTHFNACEALAFRVLTALTRSLGLPAELLHHAFKPSHTSFIRLNYYAPCTNPANPTGLQTPSDGYLAVNRHTDSGALTLLLQDGTAGLEMYYEGRWHLIPAERDNLVVNLGDVLQVWSNDRYVAPQHRVLANTRDTRLSVPYFFNPSYKTDYAPLDGLISSANPPRYRSINWGEFRQQRAAGDYANLGSEVQIGDYRVDAN